MRSFSSNCRYELTSVSVIAVVAGALPAAAGPLVILSSFACRRAASRRVTGSAAKRLQTRSPAKSAEAVVRFIALLSYLNAEALLAVYRNYRGGSTVARCSWQSGMSFAVNFSYIDSRYHE